MLISLGVIFFFKFNDLFSIAPKTLLIYRLDEYETFEGFRCSFKQPAFQTIVDAKMECNFDRNCLGLLTLGSNKNRFYHCPSTSYVIEDNRWSVHMKRSSLGKSLCIY